jgi:hypothetical protein
MALRFACPSCRQPIEIDDEWAGKSVGCPYCKKVVAAPTSSTWPPDQIPVATPVGSAFQPPAPPDDRAVSWPGGVRTGTSVAPWALTLAITSAILAVFAAAVWLLTVFSLAMQTTAVKKLGPNPSPEQVQKVMPEAMQEITAGGRMPSTPLSTAAAIVGGLCGIGGLALAIRSLLWQQPRRGMAIAACVISAAFTCCQGMLLLVSLAGQVGHR